MKDNENSEISLSSNMNEKDRLFDYIINQDLSSIEEMLSSNSLPIWEYKSEENHNSTVLNLSVYKNNYQITKVLLDYCKKNNNDNFKNYINEQNEQGIAPIHYASFRGDINTIKLLIENGAEIEKKTNRGLNVIHYCAQGNKPNSLMFFYFLWKKQTNIFENKYELITAKDNGGSTPLHWAVYSLAEDFLLYLINLDIFKSNDEKLNFINQKDNQSNTPLHLCITSKSSRIALKLLQSGADPLIRDQKGRTPLELAREKKQADITKILENNQSCQFCEFKAPVKQTKKSYRNIICVFSFQIIATIILFGSSLPIAIFNLEGFTKYLIFLIYIVLLFLFFYFYIVLLAIDPGLRKKKNLFDLEKIVDKNNDLTKYCYKCFIQKTRNSKHCIICNNCYDDFDHHCFWINKCVAKNNYSIFLIFLFIVFIYLVLLLIIISYVLYNINNLFSTEIKDIDYCESFFIFYESICKFLFEKEKEKEKFKFRLVHLILNILLIVIILGFLIPESLLLGLHLHVCCTNYREQKRRRQNSSTFSSTSEMSEDANALINPKIKQSQV
jgi:ankyrin repeat protein